MTFVVIAIDVASPEVDLKCRVKGTAPHITILPCVRRVDLRSRAAGGWKELLAAVDRLQDEPLELRGPVRVRADLDWLECTRGCRGRAALLELHRLATERLVRPDTQRLKASFFGSVYRPHLTTAWHLHAEQASLPHKITVHAVNLALYSYQSVPWLGLVSRETSERGVAAFDRLRPQGSRT